MDAKYHDSLQDLTIMTQDAPDESCAQCGAVLTDDEPWICDTCTADAYWRDMPDPEPWSERFPEPWIPRALDWPSVAVLLLASLVAVVIGTAGLEHVQAQTTATMLTAPGPINGRVYQWPDIGTDAYTRSCSIVRWWEDGGMYVFDPEEQEWSVMSATR